MLGLKEINLLIVKSFATSIEREYNYSISYFYDAMEKKMYIEIIEPIRKTIQLFCKKVKPTLLKLKKYKDENERRIRRISVFNKKRI